MMEGRIVAHVNEGVWGQGQISIKVKRSTYAFLNVPLEWIRSLRPILMNLNEKGCCEPSQLNLTGKRW